MILGSQRSPSTKKDYHVSTRQWQGKNSPQSRISNKKFGTSFDGFSEVSKANETFQADLDNVEFEVSYDFTKEIRENIAAKKQPTAKKTKTQRESLLGNSSNQPLANRKCFKSVLLSKLTISI